MTAHLRTQGLSRRAYARQRGCSESAVRQAIADGRLKPALYRDGSINAEKADSVLAQSTIAGKEPPSELSEARVRKLRAQCALLRDEIEALEASVIPERSAREMIAVSSEHVASRLRIMVDEAAPAMVRLTPVAAAAALKDATDRALTDLAATKVSSTLSEKPLRQRGLARLTATELASLKTTLGARRLELQGARQAGGLVKLEDVSRDMIARFMRVRGKLLALPSRCAPLLNQVDQTEARQVLSRAVEEAIAELASRFAAAPTKD